jgi:hypothetical protein
VPAVGVIDLQPAVLQAGGMTTRREFFGSLAAAGAAARVVHAGSGSGAGAPAPTADGRADRRYWVSVLERLAGPVLGALSRRELKKLMPVEAANPADRRGYTHLEAFGRLMAGIAPWLELGGLEGAEAALHGKLLEQSHASLDAATDPQSPDFMNFERGGQPLVDAAFLAQSILRAPRSLWASLDPRVRPQIVAALEGSRAVPTPTDSNWVMFSAMVEAALLEMGRPTVEDRLEGSLRRMLGWYKGDGAYGDGEWFHFDYYNSFVIHPMLVDVLGALRRHDVRFEAHFATVVGRARRYAAVLERLVAPDGTFPCVGRSATYRFGALQVLAQVSLMREPIEGVKPAQVRCALTSVIRRMMEAPGTFDESGWLRLGFCGHQPTLAERYISTGSLYLCSAGLLPLGLPPEDDFWAAPPERWTSQRAWSGEALPADHAIRDEPTGEVPSLRRNERAAPNT